MKENLISKVFYQIEFITDQIFNKKPEDMQKISKKMFKKICKKIFKKYTKNIKNDIQKYAKKYEEKIPSHDKEHWSKVLRSHIKSNSTYEFISN